MSKKEKRNILIALGLCFFSGVSIYILDNYFQVSKEWGLVSHPFLDKAKTFHYLVTPLLILAIGYILKNHIFKKISNLKNESKKTTGVALAILLILLIYTGQSLLYITSEDIKFYAIYSHLIIGVLSTTVILIHLKKKS